MPELPQLNNAKLVSAAKAATQPVCWLLGFIVCYQLTLALQFGLSDATLAATNFNTPPAASNQRWTWFSAKKAPPKQEPKQEEVQESRLNAKLLGIIQRSEGSVAIIDTGNKRDGKVFREGDKLTRSVTVHKIESDRVLIRERGAIRSLTMETKRSEDIVAQKTPEQPQALNQLLPPNLSSPLLAGVSFIKTPSGETGMSLGRINQKLLAGTELQPDDVVLAAGGTPVDQILNSPNSYQNLLQLNNIDITVMRDGVEQQVSINPRSVTPNVMRLIANQNR